MESAMTQFIMEWGPVGVIILFAMYIIYDKVKCDLKNPKSKQVIDTTGTKILDKIDRLEESVNNIKADVKVLETKFETKFDSMNDIVSQRMDFIESKIINTPTKVVDTIKENRKEIHEEHNRKLIEQMRIAPSIHTLMAEYLTKCNCDHILLGTLHNGNSALNGLPYCKFDIVLEKYDYKNDIDIDYAPVYKNIDLMLHGKLPLMLIQENFATFNLDNDELSLLDDLLYRRAKGGGIKQIAFCVVRDRSNLPIGTVICLKLDNEPMNDEMIKDCARDVSNIYNGIV